MKIFDTSALDEKMMPLLSSQEAAWIYNGLDVCVTAEVFNELSAQLDEEPDNVKATYKTALAKMAPILEMSMRGTYINEEARQSTIRELENDLRLLDAKFQRIMVAVFGGELNWRSPTQLKNLFYGMLQLKEVKKRNAQGVFAATVNREALEYFDIYLYARPLARFILAMRDLHKQLSFLKTEIDKDQRIRTTYNIAGTNTGRLASSMSEFGTGCVRPTAEALTPNGWRPIRSLCDGELIAQWDDGEISFVPATFHWFEAKNLLQLKTEQIRLAVTGGHRVLWRGYGDDEYRTEPALKASERSRLLIPIGGTYVGGKLEVPAYLAMLLADFSLEGAVWRGAFKKERKIERFLSFGLPHSEIKGRSGYRRFSVHAHQDLPTSWGPWVLSLTPESAEALVEEAKHWDAHVRGNSFIFYTSRKEQAEWFQTLCHLTGRSTTVRTAVNSDEAYGNNSIIYSVNVKPKTEAQVLRKHWEVIEYEGRVGCPTVPSSFWLVREDGFISVTGNTNLQNVNRKLRFPFTADPEMYMVNVDLEQADGRNVGAICHNIFLEADERDIARILNLKSWQGPVGPEFASKFLDACESGDLHTSVCRMTWPELAWPDDPKDWKKFCDGLIAHGQDSYRQLAKKLGHGTNYYGTPRTMAKHAHVPTKIIEDFQDRYFGQFPVIKAWHNWTINEIATHGTLTTPFGRRRMFFGRGNDASTWRKAIAYVPQSMTGEQIDRGLLQIWRRFREVQLLNQVHDSILFQLPFRRHAELIPEVLETMKVTIELRGGRPFTVPLEAAGGWNWGYFDETNNKYGLKKWKGKEDRERPSPKSRLRDYLKTGQTS